MQQHYLPEREQLLLFLPFFPPPVFYFQFCNAKYQKSFQILSTNASVEFPKHQEMAIETLLQELRPLHFHNLIEVAWLACRRGKTISYHWCFSVGCTEISGWYFDRLQSVFSSWPRHNIIISWLYWYVFLLFAYFAPWETIPFCCSTVNSIARPHIKS